jgi:hypothetical protein
MKATLNNKSIFILLSSLFVSCSSGLKLSGIYFDTKSPFTFTIKDDSTFNYRYKFQFDYKYSDGYWSRKREKQIALTSNLKSKILPLIVSEDEGVNSIEVNLNMPDTEKAYYQCSVFVNDCFFIRKRSDSITSLFVGKPISSLFFKLNADERIPARFLDSLITEKYFLKSNGSKNLKVDILYKDSLFNYKVFNGEIIKIKRKGMKFYSSESDSWIYLTRKKE